MALRGVLIITAFVALNIPDVAPASPAFRFHLKPGWTLAQAIRHQNQKLSRTAGFSNADCWLYDGSVKTGWRHAACVASYQYAGATYRVKITWTAVSRTRERYRLVIPGVKTQTAIVSAPRDSPFVIR